MHGVDVVHEPPKPKYPLRDLIKLWQEAKQKEEADRRAEHWNRAYNSLKQDYLTLKDRDLCSSCQRVKDETEEGETVELCHECSTGRETRKSLELKLDKVYQDLHRGQTQEHAQCTRTRSPAATISRAKIQLIPYQNRCHGKKKLNDSD